MTDSKLPRVAFLGTSGGVSFSRLGFDAALNRIGYNTGNMIFQSATWESIRNPKFLVGFGGNIQSIRENADVLFIPAANQVNPSWDLQGWADFVESLDLPVVVVGLGAQSSIGSSTDLKLKPGTERFLSIIAERTSNIGVRGAFTAEVLNNLGIKNTVVTGCPSNFTNENIQGETIASKLDEVRTGKFTRSCYVAGTMEPETRAVEQRLFRLARSEYSDFVFQTNDKILRTIYSKQTNPESLEYFKWESAILSPESRTDLYIDEVLSKGKFYSDARTWIDEAGKYDITYGMRIHGNIAAIQGGGLGICIAFDSRTLELAETMGYPYALASEILAMDRCHLTGLARITKFSANDFTDRRSQLRDNVKGLMNSGRIDYTM
ncbi:polysaccharide pyruvyl transferase family protein [Pseudomonas putida]|uniref:polysaccharide pyruvyl transferase family protein n=1 Tax=Pseudomonas putida TaxID=303 RepID=UPI0009BA1836|nr:polysaccharide pyruvyl transferase family protein [Pseudomonas putida]